MPDLLLPALLLATARLSTSPGRRRRPCGPWCGGARRLPPKTGRCSCPRPRLSSLLPPSPRPASTRLRVWPTLRRRQKRRPPDQRAPPRHPSSSIRRRDRSLRIELSSSTNPFPLFAAARAGATSPNPPRMTSSSARGSGIDPRHRNPSEAPARRALPRKRSSVGPSAARTWRPPSSAAASLQRRRGPAVARRRPPPPAASSSSASA